MQDTTITRDFKVICNTVANRPPVDDAKILATADQIAEAITANASNIMDKTIKSADNHGATVFMAIALMAHPELQQYLGDTTSRYDTPRYYSRDENGYELGTGLLCDLILECGYTLNQYDTDQDEGEAAGVILTIGYRCEYFQLVCVIDFNESDPGEEELFDHRAEKMADTLHGSVVEALKNIHPKSDDFGIMEVTRWGTFNGLPLFEHIGE
ncbi:MAG: hypothetical protein K5837_04510 [Candidatus Saccharibacteria bacterium]|nr:hypothetical protein [Candidatus Saccharibacteria bacterium]